MYQKSFLGSVPISDEYLFIHMDVDEARGVCKDLSRWCSVVSTPMGKRREFMYVCIYLSVNLK